MTTKLERLERIEAEAAALRKEIENESKPKTVCFTPDVNESHYYLSVGADGNHLSAVASCIHPPKAAFRDQETADAYAEAFNVMLELRLYADGGEYCICGSGGGVYSTRVDSSHTFGSAFGGRYSSREQAELAVKSVGEERIIAAIRTLCGVV